MYIRSTYKHDDIEAIKRLIQNTGLATLVTNHTPYPCMTNTPLEIVDTSDSFYLEGHMAKANPHWRLFEKTPEVLVHFLHPAHHYISSSWYEAEEVPTWNYMSVQIQGKVSLITDKSQKWALLKRLTDRYEASVGEHLNLDALPQKIKNQVDGITAFHIIPESIDATFKLSQNRSLNDQDAVVKALSTLEGNWRAKILAESMHDILTN